MENQSFVKKKKKNYLHRKVCDVGAELLQNQSINRVVSGREQVVGMSRSEWRESKVMLEGAVTVVVVVVAV